MNTDLKLEIERETLGVIKRNTKNLYHIVISPHQLPVKTSRSVTDKITIIHQILKKTLGFSQYSYVVEYDESLSNGSIFNPNYQIRIHVHVILATHPQHLKSIENKLRFKFLIPETDISKKKDKELFVDEVTHRDDHNNLTGYLTKQEGIIERVNLFSKNSLFTK